MKPAFVALALLAPTTEGEKSRQITLSTNDPANASVTLTLAGRAVQPVVVDKPYGEERGFSRKRM